ncbi:MAG: hypothetical protein ABEJ82_10420 [Haloplanus sp.]
MPVERRWVAAALVVALVLLVPATVVHADYTTATISDGQSVTVDVHVQNATATAGNDAPTTKTTDESGGHNSSDQHSGHTGGHGGGPNS